MGAGPDIVADGKGITETVFVTLVHNVVYVIVAVPFATPVTIPVEPTVAIPVLLLLQVPPVVASVNAIVEPWQTDAGPVIAAAVGYTVRVCVAGEPQPVL